MEYFMNKKDAEDVMQLTRGLKITSSKGDLFMSGGTITTNANGYLAKYEGIPIYNSEVKVMTNYLYEVTVVDQDGFIVIDKKVVAKDEESAKFKSGVYLYLINNSKTPEDVTIIVTRGASVKVKESEKPVTQKIEITGLSEEAVKTFSELVGANNNIV